MPTRALVWRVGSATLALAVSTCSEDAATPLSYEPCATSDDCPSHAPVCLFESWEGVEEDECEGASCILESSYCTRACGGDGDCAAWVPDGTARSRCLYRDPATGLGRCVLDCAFGKVCPTGMGCAGECVWEEDIVCTPLPVDEDLCGRY